VLDERDDAAVVLELMALRFALVVERDENARVQECQLAETLSERVEAELDGLEDFLVGTERDLGAALLRGPGLPERTGGLCPILCPTYPPTPQVTHLA
jgi:hypothetical protein